MMSDFVVKKRFIPNELNCQQMFTEHLLFTLLIILKKHTQDYIQPKYYVDMAHQISCLKSGSLGSRFRGSVEQTGHSLGKTLEITPIE